MTFRIASTAAFAFVAASFFVSTAFAQDTFCAEKTSCTTAVSFTSATTIVGIGATTMSRIRNRRVAALDRYLRNNRLSVLGAAALGAGSVIDDIATLAALPPHRRLWFGRALRRERLALRRAFERTSESGYLEAVAVVLAIAESPHEPHEPHEPKDEEN